MGREKKEVAAGRRVYFNDNVSIDEKRVKSAAGWAMFNAVILGFHNLRLRRRLGSLRPSTLLRGASLQVGRVHG